MTDIPLPLSYLRDQHRVSLSPDGNWIAYVVVNSDRKRHRSSPELFDGANVWITEIGTGMTYRLLEDAGNSWAPCWSPDGSVAAFFSDPNGPIEPYVWCRQTKTCRKLAGVSIPGFWLWHPKSYPRWLDNRTLCLTVCSDMEPAGVSIEMESDVSYGKSTAQIGFWEGGNPSGSMPCQPESDPLSKNADIGLIDVETGTLKRIHTPFRNMILYPSPDGNRIAVVVRGEAPSSPQEFCYTEDVYVVNAADLAEWRQPVPIASNLLSMWAGGVRHHPAWSPDSRYLSFTNDNIVYFWNALTQETVTVETQLSPPLTYPWFCSWVRSNDAVLVANGSQLTLVNISGVCKALKQPDGKTLRGILRRSDEDWIWSPGNKDCIGWYVDKQTHYHGLQKISLDGGESIFLTDEPIALYLVPKWTMGGRLADITRDGSLIFASEDPLHPQELWMGGLKGNGKRQITQINPPYEIPRFANEILTWKDSRGHSRQGVLLLPYNRDVRLPLVVSIYPGVSDIPKRFTWGLGTASSILPPQVLLLHGYAVFIPELFPGEKRFMSDLSSDIIAACSKAIETGAVDETKLAIMGHSFGGYAVNCIITQTTLFKAAVSSGSTGNLAALYGASYRKSGPFDGYGCQLLETGQFGIGSPWDNPLLYINNSPLFFLDRVKTPLLLIGGSEDGMYQPQEIYVGLRRLNKNVQCVSYGGEGHTPSDWSYTNRQDVAKRVLAWFSIYVKQFGTYIL